MIFLVAGELFKGDTCGGDKGALESRLFGPGSISNTNKFKWAICL